MKFDFTNSLKENLKEGVSLEDVKSVSGKLHTFLESFRQSTPGFVRILDETKEKEKLRSFAESRLKKIENFVVVGIGGSALGIQALVNAFLHPYWNCMKSEKRDGFPRIFVMDNVDPEHISSVLDEIKPENTLFNIISKSGSTAETMANYSVVRGLLNEKGLKPNEHLVFTTDPNEGALRKIAIEEDIPAFEIPPNVGGRFSVLTSVGLLSAFMLGLNVEELLNGAKETVEKFLSQDDTLKNPVLFNAALHYLYSKDGKRISVMMPYSNALYTLADWYRQLWAESLGKEKNLTGEIVNAGQTPVKSLGTVDQHSQVQLYMEGPNDKVITFLRVEKFRKDIVLPKVHPSVKAFSYLGGKEMSKLINSEQEATALALTEKGRPNLTIIFEEINEREIGSFFLYYELVVSAMGFLYGVNAFDQPGVELGKMNTYALMDREGYEERKAHIESVKKNLNHFTM